MATPPLKINDSEIRTIYDLLDLMRVRPGMWIGESSVTRLTIFLEGFKMGVIAAHGSLEEETPRFHGFHAWVARRLGRALNANSWSSMLLESCGTELAAFERFWTELDAFRLA